MSTVPSWSSSWFGKRPVYFELAKYDETHARVARGTRMIFSSAPHPEPWGKCGLAVAVISAPITAKSPDSISKTSGQLWPPEQRSGEAAEAE